MLSSKRSAAARSCGARLRRWPMESPNGSSAHRREPTGLPPLSAKSAGVLGREGTPRASARRGQRRRSVIRFFVSKGCNLGEGSQALEVRGGSCPYWRRRRKSPRCWAIWEWLKRPSKNGEVEHSSEGWRAPGAVETRSAVIVGSSALCDAGGLVGQLGNRRDLDGTHRPSSDEVDGAIRAIAKSHVPTRLGWVVTVVSTESATKASWCTPRALCGRRAAGTRRRTRSPRTGRRAS